LKIGLGEEVTRQIIASMFALYTHNIQFVEVNKWVLRKGKREEEHGFCFFEVNIQRIVDFNWILGNKVP